MTQPPSKMPPATHSILRPTGTNSPQPRPFTNFQNLSEGTPSEQSGKTDHFPELLSKDRNARSLRQLPSSTLTEPFMLAPSGPGPEKSTVSPEGSSSDRAEDQRVSSSASLLSFANAEGGVASVLMAVSPDSDSRLGNDYKMPSSRTSEVSSPLLEPPTTDDGSDVLRTSSSKGVLGVLVNSRLKVTGNELQGLPVLPNSTQLSEPAAEDQDAVSVNMFSRTEEQFGDDTRRIRATVNALSDSTSFPDDALIPGPFLSNKNIDVSNTLPSTRGGFLNAAPSNSPLLTVAPKPTNDDSHPKQQAARELVSRLGSEQPDPAPPEQLLHRVRLHQSERVLNATSSNHQLTPMTDWRSTVASHVEADMSGQTDVEAAESFKPEHGRIDRTGMKVTVLHQETHFATSIGSAKHALESNHDQITESRLATSSAVKTSGATSNLGTLVKTIHLRLEPATLGEVVVKLHLKGQSMSMEIQPQVAQTAAMLRSDSSSLSAILRMTGPLPDAITVQILDPDNSSIASDNFLSTQGQGSRHSASMQGRFADGEDSDTAARYEEEKDVSQDDNHERVANELSGGNREWYL